MAVNWEIPTSPVFWTNSLACFALVVSVVAAAFSWKSAKEAKLANKISVHTLQKDLYRAFVVARMHLEAKGMSTTQAGIYEFFSHVKTARLYLPRRLARQVAEFYEECYGIQELHSQMGFCREELSIIDSQPLGVPAGERATDQQRNEAKLRLESARKNLSECVMRANTLGGQLDEKLIEYLRIV